MKTTEIIAGVIEYVQTKIPKSGVLITILEPDQVEGTKILTGGTENIKDITKLYRRLADEIESNDCIKCKMTDMGVIVRSESDVQN